MTLYAPPRHDRRANDFYRTPFDLAFGLLAGLRRAGLKLPTPIHDPCAGDGALLDGLGLTGSGSDLFPDAYPSDSRLLTAPVDARDPKALARVLNGARALVSNPPFKRDALPIAESLVELVHAGSVEMAALLLPALWEAAGSPRRVALMREMDLRILCCWRPTWIEGTAGGGKLNYAWHVWTREPPPFPHAIQVTLEEAETWRAP
jgi:hypothetical protein